MTAVTGRASLRYHKLNVTLLPSYESTGRAQTQNSTQLYVTSLNYFAGRKYFPTNKLPNRGKKWEQLKKGEGKMSLLILFFA